jgi:uncharacterized membrane protein YedE/YeeE
MILFFGFLFGAILQFASLNKYNVISGLATLDDFAVVKTISLAIGIGIILLSLEIGLGFASFHIKPFMLGGIIMGGLIFGTGMAILGYCPGTLAISVGEGSVDAFVGVLGGLLGGLVYTLILPLISGILGPNLGTMSLNSIMGTTTTFYIVSSIIGVLFIVVSLWLNKIEESNNYKWLFSGIALAILNPIMLLIGVFNRPIGASTSFPYVADFVTGFTQNDYFAKIEKPGNWELIFLTGAFLAGLIISLIKKEFKIELIYSNWKKFKGNSSIKRAIWAFIGGFILIIGARMAGGCTSGHILSGGMQLAISSLVFAVFTFVGLLVTGKFFYKK